MSTTEYRFIQPLDVLFLRGNQLFGDPGSFGQSLIPPWPSVAAGAIRSRMLADDGVDLARFARGAFRHPVLGTPQDPGSFRLTGFYLADNHRGPTKILVAPPADLVIAKDADDNLTIQRLEPKTTGLPSSCTLARLPVMAQDERTKPASGYWLTQAGWTAYLAGQVPALSQLRTTADLWSVDTRIGIGMNRTRRSVDTGKLFTTQAVVMKSGIGFLAAVTGATPPSDGLLRLGGDGRGATMTTAAPDLPAPDYAALAEAGRCRLVLTSPGIFPEGWKLPGMDGNHHLTLVDIRADVVSACIPRADTVSGWDLAKGGPKAAQRVAPTGSVYWLDNLQVSGVAALQRLVEDGLWPSDESNALGPDNTPDGSRRAEGFNRCTLAAW